MCSLQISHGSADEIIHDELGFHSLCEMGAKRAYQTVETINQLGFEMLEHPAYSPDHI